MKKKRKVRKRVDPYRAAQARQRKAANLARRAVLQDERKEAMGDPVQSTETPFVQSLRSPTPLAVEPEMARQGVRSLNYFLNADELQRNLQYSKYLTEPLPPEDQNKTDPIKMKSKAKEHDENHANAQRALRAIASLENGSSQDRTRVNIQRCIAEFGRHHTDTVLPPKPASSLSGILSGISFGQMNPESAEEGASKRVGPDTGSSEVQAAILTTKINVLAENLHKKDKHNKRNLRLLVHKRQKLLAYLRKKERGGPRWQNLVERLGINDAMWKGEISL